MIQWEARPYNFFAPCFNPNNPNEFVYVKSNPDRTDIELRKHNLVTNADELLSPIDNFNYKLSWSRDGWIYFNNVTNVVWRIREDGQSLQQFTFEGGNFNAVAHPTGNYVIVNRIFTASSKMLLLDSSGAVLDTLPGGGNRYSWLSDTLLIGTTYQAYTLYHFNSISAISSGALPTTLYTVEPLPNNSFAYTAGGGIIAFNYLSWQINTLKEKCGDKHTYHVFVVSPDKQKILAEKETITAIDTVNEIYHFQQNIVLMNIDGSNEQVIELPQ